MYRTLATTITMVCGRCILGSTTDCAIHGPGHHIVQCAPATKLFDFHMVTGQCGQSQRILPPCV